MIDNLILRLKYFQILTLFWLITLSSGCLQQIFWMVGHRVSLQHTNHVQVLGLKSIFQNIDAFKEFLFSEYWLRINISKYKCIQGIFIFRVCNTLNYLKESGEKKDYSRCSDIHFHFWNFNFVERKDNSFSAFLVNCVFIWSITELLE